MHPISSISSEALKSLVDCRQQFLAFIEKRVESREVAEDILQSAFVRGIEKGGAVREDQSAVAWFYRLLRNAIIDHYRRSGASARLQQTLLLELPQAIGQSEPLEKEVCECVLHLAGTLKTEYQQAIQIVDLQEGSLAELGSQAQISTGNAAVRVHRARAALKERVRTTCGLCATHGCLDCDCGSNKESVIPPGEFTS